MPRPPRKANAFTIVELLIVVGIIAVLASIILPMAGSLRTRARGVNCASNERQIYTALVAFAAEHDGYLPIPAVVSDGASGAGKYRAWAIDDAYVATGGTLDFTVGTLWPYLGGLEERRRAVWCPADAGESSNHSGKNVARNFSYSLNANIGNPVPAAPAIIGTVKLGGPTTPASKILIYEEEAPNDEWGLGGTNPDDWPAGRHGTARAVVTAGGPQNQLWMVEGLGNQCFFDGHVDLISPQTIYNDVNKFPGANPSMWYPLK